MNDNKKYILKKERKKWVYRERSLYKSIYC